MILDNILHTSKWQYKYNIYQTSMKMVHGIQFIIEHIKSHLTLPDEIYPITMLPFPHYIITVIYNMTDNRRQINKILRQMKQTIVYLNNYALQNFQTIQSDIIQWNVYSTESKHQNSFKCLLIKQTIFLGVLWIISQ